MQSFVKDQARLQQTISDMQAWWADKLHILADFDRTLTKGFYKGKKISSIASFLYEGDYLCKEYQEQAQAFFDHYYPIEQDSNVDRASKKQAMEERRSKHLDILVKYKLSRNDIDDIVTHKELQLRDGYEQFFGTINKRNIPLVIMSASGIGYDAIDDFLRHHAIDQDALSIISNKFVWNAEWYAIGREEPVIHSLNKSETTLKQFPTIYNKVHTRTNVILLWDSLHDLDMIDGFEYANLITLWRCHSDDETTKKKYCEAYDIVIFDDGPLDMVNTILWQIVAL